MSSTGSGPSPPNAQGFAPTTHQDRLTNYCRAHGLRPPTFQVVSDRRGGRTAWSCVVSAGGRNFPAHFWYDGQYVNQAKEDAAQEALQVFGVLPRPPVPQVRQPPPQPQQSYGPMYGINSQ